MFNNWFKHQFPFWICVTMLQGCRQATGIIPSGFDDFIGKNLAGQIASERQQFPILDSATHPLVYQKLDSIKLAILASPEIRHRNDFSWKLKVIKDDSTLNAFCVAGGYIYVYTGLIRYLDNEAQLAGVMAHEIAHADNRHTTRQIIKNSALGLVIWAVTGSDAGWLVNFGQQLLGLTFSRSDEQEADEFAVRYLSSTSYDSREVGGFFQKLIKQKKDHKIPEFLSTHPASDNRVQDIHAVWIATGRKPGKKFQSEYSNWKKRALV